MRAKLLLVIDGLEFGGGERVFLQLAAGLRDRLEVSVASMSGGTFEHELRQLGVNFCPLDMSRRFSLKPVCRIKAIIRDNKIDLVHSQGARADFFARMAGRLAGQPHIFCTIAMPVEGFDLEPLRKKIYRFIDDLTERYVERFIVVSDSLKQTLIERRRIPAHQIVRIYNGIELDQYRPDAGYVNLRKGWGIPQDVPLIGAISRMVWQKGLEFLVQATPKVLQHMPDAKFVVVGKGPLEVELRNLVKKLGLSERVLFTGFRSDIPEVLSALDVLVLPSLREGLPMTLLEGMAMAKPIVATDIEGISEVVEHGKTGILVPPRNPSALADGIVSLLNNKEKAQQMGLAARKRVAEKFSVETMIRETEVVYQSVVRNDL